MYSRGAFIQGILSVMMTGADGGVKRLIIDDVVQVRRTYMRDYRTWKLKINI